MLTRMGGFPSQNRVQELLQDTRHRKGHSNSPFFSCSQDLQVGETKMVTSSAPLAVMKSWSACPALTRTG